LARTNQYREATYGMFKVNREGLARKQRAAQRESNLEKRTRRSRRSCDQPSAHGGRGWGIGIVGGLESPLGFCISLVLDFICYGIMLCE